VTVAAPTRIAVLARDEALIAAVSQSSAARGAPPPLILRSNADLLAAVLDGVGGFDHLLLQEGAREHEATLVDALAEASPFAAISSLPRAPGGGLAALIEDVLEGRMVLAAPALSTGGMPGRLADGGLLLRYQPIVRLKDRKLVMVEALSRWRSEPVALGPGSFVPHMERAGLARLLAGAVIRIAARDMMRLPALRGVRVSVNLPVEEIEKPDVVAWIAAQIRRSRLPRTRLAIELTETSPVKDFAKMHRAVRRLRAAGHDVLIDDFELDDRRRRLLRLPFSGVKLDRSLVQATRRSGRARQQVRQIAKLGMTVTAEGISTRPLWNAMRALGAHRAQGFWLARPLPVAALPAWAARWKGGQPR
jgi:EAL domain-containing protein (putative c-di-GMP-specific phosphodiesterase class I)